VRSRARRQRGARLLRRDDGIDEAARGGVARVELLLVVGAHRVDLRLQLLVRLLLPLLLQLVELRPNSAMTALSPSITPMRPVGQVKMKSGSKPCPAIA
jgi:hypothetical protein